MNKEVILDIGIGRGGTYINRDPPNVFRIGIDKDHRAMWLAQLEHPVTCCYANINPQITHFCFADKSISSVDIILPFDELLLAMTDATSNFWPEISRVAKNRVNVIVDTENDGRQKIESCGTSYIITSPNKLIIRNLQSAGFNIMKHAQLTHDQLAAFGTQCSIPLAGYMQNIIPSRAYNIVAAVPS